jgi:hypothetical protein
MGRFLVIVPESKHRPFKSRSAKKKIDIRVGGVIQEGEKEQFVGFVEIAFGELMLSENEALVRSCSKA